IDCAVTCCVWNVLPSYERAAARSGAPVTNPPRSFSSGTTTLSFAVAWLVGWMPSEGSAVLETPSSGEMRMPWRNCFCTPTVYCVRLVSSQGDREPEGPACSVLNRLLPTDDCSFASNG